MAYSVCIQGMSKTVFQKPYGNSFYYLKRLLTSNSEMVKPSDHSVRKSNHQLSIADSVTVDKHVTVEDVDRFCQLTGDFNTVHTEARIVHGALLNGLVSGVIGTVLPGPGTMVVSQTLNFPNSCVAPQVLAVTVRITSARKIVRCEFNCRTSEGIVVLDGDAKLVMRKE